MNSHNEYHGPTAGEVELSLLDLLLLVSKNLKLLLAVPVAAGILAFGIASLIPPTFVATTRLLPPQPQQTTAATLLTTQLGTIASGVGAAALGIKNPADLYVSMIKSRTVADKLVKRFNLRDLYNVEFDEDARRVLAGRTTANASKEGLIIIEVEDRDPRRASEMANAYVDALRELTSSLAVTEAAQRRLFFEKQLKQAKDDLTHAEIELRRSGISEATLKTLPGSTLEGLARLKAQVTAQEVKLSAMRGFMTEANPEYKLAQNELLALRSQLAKAEQIDGSKATGAGTEYVSRFRDFKYHETLFELMAKQYEVARLDEARDSAVMQVVDTAVPPERKSKPRRLMITLVVTGFTFLVVLLLVFVRHTLRIRLAPPGRNIRSSSG